MIKVLDNIKFMLYGSFMKVVCLLKGHVDDISNYYDVGFNNVPAYSHDACYLWCGRCQNFVEPPK